MHELISLAEYAKIHGVTSDTIRQRVLRGCFETAVKIGRNWCINKNEPYKDGRKKEIKPMNTLQMQYEYGGEWFEIWNTNESDLELAWKEMDERPEDGGCIKFKDGNGMLVVNGGFRTL